MGQITEVKCSQNIFALNWKKSGLKIPDSLIFSNSSITVFTKVGPLPVPLSQGCPTGGPWALAQATLPLAVSASASGVYRLPLPPLSFMSWLCPWRWGGVAQCSLQGPRRAHSLCIRETWHALQGPAAHLAGHPCCV